MEKQLLLGSDINAIIISYFLIDLIEGESRSQTITHIGEEGEWIAIIKIVLKEFLSWSVKCAIIT